MVTDSTSPQLDRWSIDLDAGKLFINFTEFINASSLNINKIKLQNSSSNASTFSFNLSSSTISSLGVISEAIIINLSGDDWLQAESLLYATGSYILLDFDAIRDQAILANKFVLMTDGQAAVSVFTHVKPKLIGFEIDLAIAVITLKFSRAMLAYADTSKITVKSIVGQSNCTLTGGTVLSANNTVTLSIQMNFADRSCIKLDSSLGKSLETTAIAVQAAAFKDFTLVFENSAAGVANASHYTSDVPIDNSTTVTCINSLTNSDEVVRLGQTVLCTIVPKYLNTIQPVFLANFLDIQVSNPSYLVIQALTITISGTAIDFEVMAPVVDPVGSQSFDIIVKKFDHTVLATDSILLVGAEKFEYSRQSCVGPQGILNEARFGDLLACTIAIRGRVNGTDNVATTGLATDFNQPLNNSAQAGTSVFSLLQSSMNYSFVNFTVSSTIIANPQCAINLCVAFRNPIASCYFNPSTCRGQGITITGSIPNIGTGLRTDFLQSPVTINIRGTPTNKSVLACSEQGRTDQYIRNGVIVCTIFVYDSSGIYPTTGFVTDFIAPVVKSSNGSLLTTTGMSVITEHPSSVTNFQRGKQMKVSFFVPTGLVSNDTISIEGRLSDGSLFSTAKVFLTFVGSPSPASILTCTGTETLTSVVHVGETVTCIIELKDISGASCTGYPEDFLPLPDVGMGTDLTSIAFFTNDATIDNKMIFSFSAPSVAASMNVSVSLANNVSLNSPVLITSRLRATTASTLTCVGSYSGSSTQARANEVVYCTITARDISGSPIATFAADFAIASVTNGVNPTIVVATPGDGTFTTFSFNVTASISSTSILTIVGKLSFPAPNSFGNVLINLVGVPTQLSRVNCLGKLTGQNIIAPGEVVKCDIISSPTRALKVDFTIDINPSYNISALTTVDSGLTYQFSFNSSFSLAALSIITVTGSLANGSVFTTSPSILTVLGIASNKSTLYCENTLTPASSLFVYPNQDVVCTIYIRNVVGSLTTGSVSDFTTANTTGGVSSSVTAPLQVAGNNSILKFSLSAPINANTKFNIIGFF